MRAGAEISCPPHCFLYRAETSVITHREAWHRPSVDGFVETMRRLRWGEVGFASLRTWGTLGNNYWWAPREAGCPVVQLSWRIWAAAAMADLTL